MLQQNCYFFFSSSRVYWTPNICQWVYARKQIHRKSFRCWCFASKLWRKPTTKAVTVKLNNIFHYSLLQLRRNSLYFKGESKKSTQFCFFDNEKTLKKFHDILQHTFNSRPTIPKRLCKIGIRLLFFTRLGAAIRFNCERIIRSAVEKMNKKLILTLKWQWKIIEIVWVETIHMARPSTECVSGWITITTFLLTFTQLQCEQACD